MSTYLLFNNSFELKNIIFLIKKKLTKAVSEEHRYPIRVKPGHAVLVEMPMLQSFYILTNQNLVSLTENWNTGENTCEHQKSIWDELELCTKRGVGWGGLQAHAPRTIKKESIQKERQIFNIFDRDVAAQLWIV